MQRLPTELSHYAQHNAPCVPPRYQDNTYSSMYVYKYGCGVVKLQEGLLKCVRVIVRAYSGNRQLQAAVIKRCKHGNPAAIADKPVNGERIAYDMKGRGYLLFTL